MSLLELVQGSDEWRKARCGSLGASAVHEVVAKTKSGWAASRANRLSIIAIERLTGMPQDTFQTPAMRDGVEREPDARLLYEFMMNSEVAQIGIALHPTIGGTHASPDGLVGDKGTIEIKSPQPAQHMATLLGEPIPSKYITQIQWQFACLPERQWCDFVSFNPDFPESMRLFIQRVERSPGRIQELEAEVVDFLNELRLTVHRLRSKYEPEAITPGELLLMAG